MLTAGPRRHGVNPPWGGRGDLGGCRCLCDLEWAIELAHRSSVGLGALECHAEEIYVWGA
jgi:hypothetical protein